MNNKRLKIVVDTIARYWLAADVLNFSGSSKPIIEYAENGESVEEAFDALDSRGETIPCKDPETLSKILYGKACLNFHIKMWAEGLEEIPLWELKEGNELSFIPEWAWKAVVNQYLKIPKSKI